MTCHRCGESTPRLTVDQVHCPRCQREVDAIVAPPTEPSFVPPWRRRLMAKDMTRSLA